MLHRFLLTILPSPALSTEVQRLRDLLHPAIGSFSGRNTPPHITLCFLDLPEAHEANIINAIAQGVIGQRPFDLHYQGITHFPDKRTIYIDPEEKDAIAGVRAPIIASLKSNDALREAVRETDHPHLTIAAGLKSGQFDKAWPMLAPYVLHPASSGEHQSEKRVAEVVLLKRPLLPGFRYVPARTFPLVVAY